MPSVPRPPRRLAPTLAGLALFATATAALPALRPGPARAAPMAYPAHPAELVGAPAPGLRVRPATGAGAVDRAALPGRRTLVAFVATWCPACATLEPTLAALSREGRVEVVAYSNEPRDRIAAHYAGRVPFPVAQCTGRTSLRWGATALPTLVLVDDEAVVRGGWRGAAPDVLVALRAGIASLGGPPAK